MYIASKGPSRGWELCKRTPAGRKTTSPSTAFNSVMVYAAQSCVGQVTAAAAVNKQLFLFPHYTSVFQALLTFYFIVLLTMVLDWRHPDCRGGCTVPSPGDSSLLSLRCGVTCWKVQLKHFQATGTMLFQLAGSPWAQEALRGFAGVSRNAAGMWDWKLSRRLRDKHFGLQNESFQIAREKDLKEPHLPTTFY